MHNKLMVADDDLLLVGSANLNNRSMMLDAECVFPVRTVCKLDLSFSSREPNSARDADIDYGAKTWRVVATHWGLASRERRVHVEQMLQSFDTSTLSGTLPGDLNEWFIYGRTLRRPVSHFYRARLPRTFPTRYPLFALDRIRVHPVSVSYGSTCIEVRLARLTWDHYPLIAQLSLLP